MWHVSSRSSVSSSSSSFFNITLSTAKQHQSSGLKLYEVRSKAQYKPKMAVLQPCELLYTCYALVTYLDLSGICCSYSLSELQSLSLSVNCVVELSIFCLLLRRFIEVFYSAAFAYYRHYPSQLLFTTSRHLLMMFRTPWLLW